MLWNVCDISVSCNVERIHRIRCWVVGQPMFCFRLRWGNLSQVFGQPFVLRQVFLDAPKPFMVDVEGGKKARRSPAKV